MQEAADDLVSLYKRVSLDDDLDDALRSELLSQLSAGLPYLSTSFSISSNMTEPCHCTGASSTAATLKLVCGEEGRSQGDIATAAMASINQFLTKQVISKRWVLVNMRLGLDISLMSLKDSSDHKYWQAQPPPAQHQGNQGMQGDLSANPYFQVSCSTIYIKQYT